jgi:hypothetical protein
LWQIHPLSSRSGSLPGPIVDGGIGAPQPISRIGPGPARPEQGTSFGAIRKIDVVAGVRRAGTWFRKPLDLKALARLEIFIHDNRLNSDIFCILVKYRLNKDKIKLRRYLLMS